MAFDLHKDLDRYIGVTPYASEAYGVYQPLLGWRSALASSWAIGGSSEGPSGVSALLEQRISSPIAEVAGPHPLEFEARPLEPGSGRSTHVVRVVNDLDSEVVRVVRDDVQRYVDDHGGALPHGAEWKAVIDVNRMMDAQAGPLKIVNDRLRTRIFASVPSGTATESDVESMRADLLRRMQHESRVAALLVFAAEGQPGYTPDDLAALFTVLEAPGLSDLLKPPDPLAGIDPTEDGGVLSSVGLIQLFRQYLFDLGTFRGEPVEHVWLAPGTTIELVEISTRRRLIEQSTEQFLQTQQKIEREVSLKDDVSEAVKEENQKDVKLGVSTTNSVSFPVYQGSASASFGLTSTRKQSRESTHKTVREQSEKLSSEITQSFKSVFRTVTETTDTRSRRHVIQNDTAQLRNYELRRKMRRVGVQVQDIGQRLCWQVFVDDPGAPLGLADLVHFAPSPDLSGLKTEDVPVPAPFTHPVVVPIPFAPVLDYTNNRANYEWSYVENGTHLSIIKGDPDDDDSQTVMGPFTFKFDSPKPGYGLTKDVRVRGVQGGKIGLVHSLEVDQSAGTFTIVMQRVNFGGENVLNLDVELVFTPSSEVLSAYETARSATAAKLEQATNAEMERAYIENVRDRINSAASISNRPPWDLREEERTTIYRSLLRRLMIDSWGLADDAGGRRLSHVRSEIIRSIFDIDSMLYFVAPEWWMPRRRASRFDVGSSVAGRTMTLTEDDTARWGGERRDGNYPITEESVPARLGSSLGWLLQLDGDDLRNAFLNAPWVKAVVPVRPGRERAALNWLRAIEGHEDDGWDDPYVGNDEPRFNGKTVGEVLTLIADDLEDVAGDLGATLQTEKVFESGFDPLTKGFDAGLPAQAVHSQWITVLPTDQLVAVEYVATDLFEPG